MSTKTRLEFVVDTVPIAQPRQRHRVYRVGGKTIAANYTPATHPVNVFKEAVRCEYLKVRKKSVPLDVPLSVSMSFTFTAPLAVAKKQANSDLRAYKGTRPDADNLAKSVMDALNMLAWRDDALIARLVVTKFHALTSESPRVRIVIEELP